jgi:hypothetical protein
MRFDLTICSVAIQVAMRETGAADIPERLDPMRSRAIFE